MHVHCFDNSLVSRVLLPSTLVLNDCPHPGINLDNDGLAQTTIHRWKSIVEDVACYVYDNQRVFDEWKTINDGISDFSLDFLDSVLRVVSLYDIESDVLCLTLSLAIKSSRSCPMIRSFSIS